jgi:Transposase DDE domain
MNTPFFPAWRRRLAPLGRRLDQLRQQSLLQLDQVFGRFLPPALLAQADEGPNSRERVFTVRRTFFGFLYQVLKPDCPCREVVRQVQALFALHHGADVDEATGAYCQARSRLPWDILPRLRCAAAAQAQKACQLWHGLCVKVVDGTSTSLPDTPKNQRAYPQSGSQKPGCGFPLLKLVGVFSLSTGALLDYAKGNKHQHELSLLRRLMHLFKPGDLVLADRGFSTYTLLALLLIRGAQGLFRLHQARPTDLRKGKRLGKNDRLFLWDKPSLRPRYLPRIIWKAIPEQISVRVLRFSLQVPGFRVHSVTLVTTLLDPEKYPAEELAYLYAERWRVELWFRDIKTSMGMEVLRCKSPKMVHKELEMFFIAYNLIRCLMSEASLRYGIGVGWLSFKGTVDSIRQFAAAIAQARSRKTQKLLLAKLLEVIARDLLPERFGRYEPRAVKRRPKPYPLLNRPRDSLKEIPHRNRYWKNNPRKSRG